MNRLHSAKLDTEHLVDGEPDAFIKLRNAGYPTNVEDEHRTVSEKADKENSAYDVYLISTYSKPPELADAVEDTIEVYVCHCGDFVFRNCPKSFSDSTPAEIGSCKHIEDIDKSARAQNDEGQMTL